MLFSQSSMGRVDILTVTWINNFKLRIWRKKSFFWENIVYSCSISIILSVTMPQDLPSLSILISDSKLCSLYSDI